MIAPVNTLFASSAAERYAYSAYGAPVFMTGAGTGAGTVQAPCRHRAGQFCE
jgi:hypothetical protein